MGRKGKNNRIDKKELYDAILDSKKKGELTEDAFLLLEQLCKNYISQFYYRDPMDREDCFQCAIMDCLQGWDKFNPNKSNNAFSYFTQTIKIGLIKGWNSIHPKKLDTISIDSGGFKDNNGIYSI